MNFRIGQGIDVHQLKKGLPLYIGGILIPHDKGSLGHSDGDVLIHSIIDAILGAISEHDIGYHFPSEEKKWKNKPSEYFLKNIYSILLEKNYLIGNIDSTIILQEPTISPYIEKMNKNISKILNLNEKDISIKATTTDKLGFIGKKKGIAATTIILILKKNGS